MGSRHIRTCLRQAHHTGILFFWLFVWSTQAQSIYQPHCRDALGMHSGAIPDEAINASSSYDLRSVGPQNSRIRTEKNGGAWCPSRHIDPDIYEWLEIDLGSVKKVTLVETQGRFGNGQGQEFAEQYMIEYQRVEGGTWVRYKNHKQEELLKGNTNTYIAEIVNIDPPIIARRVRFVPYSRRPRTICMRVELYGCTWKEGVRSYSVPQGDVRGDNLSLIDYTYDGKNINGYLTGGMGQLVDDEEGITNFRLDQHGTGYKGYEWVGWKNSSSNRPIEIVFEFETVRNFSSVRLWCNNYFQKGIRVFRMAKLYFSNGGVYYSNPAVVFTYMKDSLLEYARPVIIPIPHRTGRFIRMQLFFEARWILISEINFESDIVMGEQTVEHEAQLPDAMTTTTLSPATPAPTTTPEKEKIGPPEVSIIEYDGEEEGAGDHEDDLDNPFVVKVKSKSGAKKKKVPTATLR